ncbi:MAG: molybdopterin-dependent oxidoreductase [Pseudonocardia sp.]
MRPLPAALGRGLVAGLVAGLLLVTVQALARLVLGVAPPAELLGDRIAPLLTIDQFFGLFGVFGGYNQLKQAGILGGTGGQLAVGIAIAVAVALVARRSRTRALRLLVVLTAVFAVAAVAVLWPILGTSYVGYAPGTGRAVTLAVMVVGFALLGAGIAMVLRAIGGLPARAAAPAAPDRVPVTVGGGAGPADRPAADHAAADLGSPEQPRSVGRRAVLVGGVGVAGLGLAAASGGLGTELYRRATFSYDGLSLFGPDIAPITPNDAFYTVTKNVVDPRVDPRRWSLAVHGAVRTPGTVDLAGLRALPAVTQETTLMCISNPVGGGLESNAMWTGARLADLVAAAEPTGTPVEVLLTAVDGYTDTFSIDKAMDPTTLLAYRMNGVDLPQRHGFPVRLVVPGLFGEKNLKWITGVEVVTEEVKGFYEKQGWGPNFAIPTRARFGVPEMAPVSRGAVTALAGTAHGGDRGISRVEVSTDGGRTWTDATITYPGTRLSWALWRHDWRPALAGATTVVVRATDGDGVPQVAQERGSVPQGATGYHRLPVTVV